MTCAVAGPQVTLNSAGALSLQVCTEANPRLTIRRARFSGGRCRAGRQLRQ
jgi:hypothetical protein